MSGRRSARRDVRLHDPGPLARPERAATPMPHATRPARRRSARSVWLLTGLAFICGGLVSAAAFSIGWRIGAAQYGRRDGARRRDSAHAHARAQGRPATGLARRLPHQGSDGGRIREADRPDRGEGRRRSHRLRRRRRLRLLRREHAHRLHRAHRERAQDTRDVPHDDARGATRPGYIASQTAYLSRQLTSSRRPAGRRAVAGFQAAVKRLTQTAATVSTG